MAILSEQEAIEVMVKSACKFLEECHPAKMSYYRHYGYVGKDPQMHVSTGDRIILRKLAKEMLETIPENYRHEHNCKIYGERLVLEEFYWRYGVGNTSHND